MTAPLYAECAAPAPADLRPALGDRRLFPDLAARAYLNHGALSPPSSTVRASVTAFLDHAARVASQAYDGWSDLRARLRRQLATLINAKPAEIGLAANTTSAITDVALCFPWQAGDEAILFRGEFPANVVPWQRAAAAFHLRMRYLRADDFRTDADRALKRLERALTPRTRLVAISYVQFQTGLRVPLAEITKICHRHGVQVAVDGIQACGAVPVDVADLGVDYLACGAHKWLTGLGGSGFLYVAPRRARALRPHVAGWLSARDDFRFLGAPGALHHHRRVRRDAAMIEGGHHNNVGCAALLAAVGTLLELGVEKIFAHVCGYLDALEPRLERWGFESLRAPDLARRSCILSVRPPPGQSAQVLARRLNARGVVCSSPEGLLRFTPHWPNHLAEMEPIEEAMRAALEGE